CSPPRPLKMRCIPSSLVGTPKICDRTKMAYAALCSPYPRDVHVPSMPQVERLANSEPLQLSTQKTVDHQQENPSTCEDEQRRDEPHRNIPPACGLNTRRVDEVRMLCERTP